MINCTLSDFMVPGFSGYTPEFGTKKADGMSILARENNSNVMMPFSRQRPFQVMENDETTIIEAHAAFAIRLPNITLKLGAGGFAGCETKVLNVSDGFAFLEYMEGKTLTLSSGEKAELFWSGSEWKMPPEYALNNHADTIKGMGRNLLDVLRVSSIADAMEELRRRCNNNGEIDDTKIPDFTGLSIGDYIDLPSITIAGATYLWNDSYKNLRLLLSGLNQYKNVGDTENDKNHLLFTFENCPLTRQMNTSNTNAGGYPSSAMKTFLDGDFKNGLTSAIGNYIYTVRRLHSTKNSSWGWYTDTVFLPTEYEVFGAPIWSEVGYGGGFQCQYPIFQNSADYLVKRHNGSRIIWWMASPTASNATQFVRVHSGGYSHNNNASEVYGVAPAFCVA